MADLTGKTIASTYRDLLQIAASSTGGGLDGTARTIQDGGGNNSALQISTNSVNINGTLELGGTAITKTAEQINSIADISTLTGIAAGDAGTIYGRTLSASVGISISNADGTAGNPTFSLAATSVSAGTYAGQTTSFDVDATGRITGTNTTDTVSVGNVNTVNLSATTVNISGNTSIGGTLTMSGALAVASLSVTGDIHGNNVNVSAIDAASITVSGIVSATSFAGSGAALTSIVAASATNASYAASAGEAAVAVSANHATSANTALFASSATNATNAVSAVFASSATNATNAVSAVFANSATNATNAINVDYGGVVETSSANLGSVSASDMFVSGPVSVGDTFDVSGAVSIGGGLFVVGDVSAGNIHAGGIIYGNGAGLFNVPSEEGGTVNFVKAGTGIHVTLDGTTTTNPITASGTLALNADQSFGTVSATSFVIGGDNVAMSATVASLSATMATSIDNTNTNLTALSATMATSIDNSNTNITANSDAITSINSVIAGVSSTLATSINNTNSNVTALSATMATSIANHLPLAGGTMTGNLILNGAPSANLQAATKQYVDNLTAAAIHFHDAVRVESPDTAGNLNATYDNGTDGVGATLTNAGTQAALVIDGVTLNTSDRVLIYNQTNGYENGVYTVTDTGSVSTNWVLTRATDADSYEPNDNTGIDGGSYFFVEEGDTGAGEAYVCSNVGTITIGTTDITFTLFSSALVYTAGSGINISGSRVISTSGVPTNADLTALSATMATSINNTNTNVTALSATMATSIATQASAITSINSKIATVSGTLATSIGNSNSAITALSATLATSIATQSSAITSINSKIATVSSTLATSISTVNTRITSLSATFATSIGNQATDARVDALSATFATSIANQNQTITAGSGLTGGGSGNVTLNVGAGTGISVAADSVGLATAGAGAGTYGSTSNNTKIDTITLDAYGRVTAVATGGTGDIDGVTAGSGLTGGGTSGTVTLNVGAGTGVTVNADDIAIGQAVGTGDSVTFAGVNINGNLNAVDDIYLADQILHEGDTDTYMQFHAANQWRVVTGGTEMLEVNDSYVLLGANSVGSVETASKTGSVTPNLYVYNSFVWTLTGNITLNNPTTEVAGQSGVFIFIHSGAARTVSLGTDWETAGGAGLTLSGASGAVDIVPYYVQASGNILLGAPQLAFS